METSILENGKILEVKNLSKEFPGVKALTNFNFDLYRGEVHALIGENGAGKSTFIKLLSGAFQPDGGEINISGEKHTFFAPRTARRLGIQTVYQRHSCTCYIRCREHFRH